MQHTYSYLDLRVTLGHEATITHTIHVRHLSALDQNVDVKVTAYHSDY